MGRLLRSWSVVALVAISLVSCGGGDDDPTLRAAGSTTSAAPDPTSTTTTTSTSTSTEPDAPAGDECGALRAVADATEAVGGLDVDDWAATQAAYAEHGPALVAATGVGAEVVADDAVAADLRLMETFGRQLVEIVATTGSADEMTSELLAWPGFDEAEGAIDRVDAHATAECGFALNS